MFAVTIVDGQRSFILFLSGGQLQKSRTGGVCEESDGAKRLLKRIAAASDLQKKRTGGEVLIVTFRGDGHRPGHSGVSGIHGLLKIERQLEVFFPVGMRETAFPPAEKRIT